MRMPRHVPCVLTLHAWFSSYEKGCDDGWSIILLVVVFKVVCMLLPLMPDKMARSRHCNIFRLWS